MIDRKIVDNYIAKREEIVSNYNKEIKQLDDDYKVAIEDSLTIKVGDVVEVTKTTWKNEKLITEEIISRIEIRTSGLAEIYTSTKNKGNGKWSKKNHYWKSILPYAEDTINILRHEDYPSKLED